MAYTPSPRTQISTLSHCCSELSFHALLFASFSLTPCAGDGEINPDEFYRIMKKRGDNPLDDLLDDDDD
jgi:hypothetical protein